MATPRSARRKRRKMEYLGLDFLDCITKKQKPPVAYMMSGPGGKGFSLMLVGERREMEAFNQHVLELERNARS
jgi:hypothetical protein